MASENQDTVESEQPTSSEKPFLTPGATEIPPTKDSVELTTDNRHLHWFLLGDFAIIALLWAAYAAVVVGTDREGILNNKKKHWNSAFTVAIPMIIGLVTIVSSTVGSYVRDF
jgi:heme/copper-type cytochrome/quinol oxidase subunit 3